MYVNACVNSVWQLYLNKRKRKTRNRLEENVRDPPRLSGPVELSVVGVTFPVVQIFEKFSKVVVVRRLEEILRNIDKQFKVSDDSQERMWMFI